MNEPIEPYSPLARRLHWLTALAIVVAFPLGVALDKASPAMMDTLYRAHWSFGLLALFLAVPRVANQLRGDTPGRYPGLTRFEAVASSIVHKLLYLLILAVPLAGWLGKSAYGGAITVFGLFDMPALLSQNQTLGERILTVHTSLAKLLALCIVLHVAGALKHAFINRDGVLKRMLPGR
ncbi:MAG TPA: cytochrome b [Beijerinckiaceae bacterium]|nr:cytochrome b [Beijerinckiaceae bacterium]